MAKVSDTVSKIDKLFPNGQPQSQSTKCWLLRKVGTELYDNGSAVFAMKGKRWFNMGPLKSHIRYQEKYYNNIFNNVEIVERDVYVSEYEVTTKLLKDKEN